MAVRIGAPPAGEPRVLGKLLADDATNASSLFAELSSVDVLPLDEAQRKKARETVKGK